MLSANRIMITFAVTIILSTEQSAWAQYKAPRVLPTVRDQLDQQAGFKNLPELVDEGAELQNLYRSQHLQRQLTHSWHPDPHSIVTVALAKQKHGQKTQEIRMKMQELENESLAIESKLEHASHNEQEKLKHELRKIRGVWVELDRALHKREHGEPRDDQENRHEHQGEFHEQMKRVDALREAAERLEHGGIHDIAHELHQRAEQLEREIEQHREHRHQPAAELRDVMKNVHDLRREVGELHRKLDHILEFIEEEQGEDEDDDR